MERIAIITDSASDLSLDILKQNNISLFPLRVTYSDIEYEDKINITSTDVYNSLHKEIPKTSLPSPKTADKVLSRLKDEGYTHIIAISISSALSGTFNSFRLYLDEYPNFTYYVFDSKIIGYPQGILALEAAKLSKEGESFDNIIDTLYKLRDTVFGYFTLNSLEYLKKGGRIGKLAGTIGEFLHLKPIITMDHDGVYKSAAKARGRKQSLSKMIELLKTHLSKSKCKVWILEGDCIDEATYFMNTIKSLDNIEVMGIQPVGATVAAHSGPGMIGLAILEIK